MNSNDDATERRSNALEDIEFLARSPNRVEVLESLAEAPRTRHELRDRTDVSRITIRRMLEDFEERGWIVGEDGQYEATSRGRFVANEFSRLHSNVVAADYLGDAVSWLPVEKYGFDLWHLRDADVTGTNSWEDHKTAIQRVADVVEDTTRLWGVTTGFTHEVLENIAEITVEGDASFEAVVTPSAVRIAREDDEMWENFRSIVRSETNDVRRYASDDLSRIFIVGDDTVVLCGHSEHGPPPGAVETDNEAVRSWLRSHFESLHERADPVDAEVVAAERPDDA